MTVVVFDYSVWSIIYPEVAVSAPRAQHFFDFATGYLDNSDCSPVQDIHRRTMLLGLLTAHIASLFGPTNGQAASPLVGRISAASEGSVSVSAELNVPDTATFFAQTKYGLTYWQMMAGYRTMHYRTGPRSYARGLGVGYNGYLR